MFLQNCLNDSSNLYNSSLKSLTIASNLFPMTSSRISVRKIPRVHHMVYTVGESQSNLTVFIVFQFCIFHERFIVATLVFTLEAEQ